MFCRAQRLALAAFLTAMPTAATAQIFWQPVAPPSVTAEHASWFIAGEPVVWNGGLYYPVGTPRALNRYEMVRSGSYRGIPLYTDLNLEPNSTVFVPLAGERVQAYERPGSGMLVGTQGRPSLPPTDFNALGYGGIAQAAAGPARAEPYDPATVVLPAGVVTSPMATVAVLPQGPPIAVGTSGRPAAADGSPVAGERTIGTSGRAVVVTPATPVTTVVPPTGANTIWVEYEGRRWYAAGKSIAYNAAILNEVGRYRGWTVYSPKNDSSVIYIPSAHGRLSVYRRR